MIIGYGRRRAYGMAGSPNVRGAMLGLAEKGVEYELVFVAPPFKDPDHLARNPFGRAPVLEHDGFMLYETQAILRYVDRAFPGPALQPTNSHCAARMDQVLGIVDCYLFETWSGKIAFERLVAPTYYKRDSDLAVIEKAIPLARSCAEALETLISGPYLAGKSYSLADIRLLPHFAWFPMTPEGQEILKGKQKLSEWFSRVSERPAAKAVLQQS